jgi:lysophospholipase L1-like esterase
MALSKEIKTSLSLLLMFITPIIIIKLLTRKKSETINLIDDNSVNNNPKKILIIGDSQSAIINAQGKPITYTYPNYLKPKLNDLGIKLDVLALGGKTTDWMKKKLSERLKNEKYDRVIIYGGGNDTSNASIPLKTTLNNIQEMVDMSKNNGADAFVNLGYKIEGKFGDYKLIPLTKYLKKQEDWIPYIEKRKELQKLIPNKIKGAIFIPIYDLQSNTTDGIHPTQKGHKMVSEKIYESIIKKY